MLCHVRQKCGENRISIVKSSNLPRIMPADMIHIAAGFTDTYVPSGPMTSPSPGPTFEIDDAAPDIAVVNSSPVRASAHEIMAKHSA